MQCNRLMTIILIMYCMAQFLQNLRCLMEKMPDFQGPGPLDNSKCTADPRFPMSGELRDRAAGLLNLERELFGAWCSYLFRYLAKENPNNEHRGIL